MDSSVGNFPQEEVHGFTTPGEYERFVACIARLIVLSEAEELHVDANYGEGEIYGGRWFRDMRSGRVWRLIPPDYPFRGLWEPVKLMGA